MGGNLKEVNGTEDPSTGKSQSYFKSYVQLWLNNDV